MSGFVLYWRPGTAAMAPHAALAEIGVDYRLVEIGRDEAQEDAAYRALNPLGVVPTLLHDEQSLVLTESAAILLYLGDRFPEAQLALDRADYYRWLVFLTNTVQTAMLASSLSERYGSSEEVRAAAARETQKRRSTSSTARSRTGRGLPPTIAPAPTSSSSWSRAGDGGSSRQRGTSRTSGDTSRHARAAGRAADARRAGTGNSASL